MNLKTGACVSAITIALFVTVGFGSWQAKAQQKGSAPKGEEKPVRLTGNPTPYEFPNPWPAPLPRPQGSVDDVAIELARKVLAGGPDALPALERAALESGFAIHDTKGQELYKPEDSRAVGVSMLDLDLAVAAELTKRKDKTLVGDFVKSAAQNSALKDVKIPDLLYADIFYFADDDDDHPSRRFWGQFVLALGDESDGEFAAYIYGQPEEELCGAQATWLLYMLTAQAAIGSKEPTDEQPADAQPAEAPPTAEDPPPHGPRIIKQGQPVDVITNLNQALQLSADPTFQQSFQQLINAGQNPSLAFVELCRRRIIRLGVEVTVVLKPPAFLERTKTFGQTGGSYEFGVGAKLDISNDMRQKYQAAMAAYPQAKLPPIPPNGPVTVTSHITPPKDCDLSPTSYQRTVGSEQFEYFTIIGKTQTRHISTKPIADDSDQVIGIDVDAGERIHTRQEITIRNWNSGGVLLYVEGTIKGKGKIVYPKAKQVTWWSINRLIEGKIVLEERLPSVPYVHATATNTTRYVTWMHIPMNPTTPALDWNYGVKDHYKTRVPKIECGVGPGATFTAEELDVERPPENDEEKRNVRNDNAGAELDKGLNTFAVKTYLPKLPILINGETRDVIGPFQDVKVTWTPPTALGDALSLFDIADNPATVQQYKPYKPYHRDYSFKGMYDRADGVGKKDVDIKFSVDVFLNDVVSEEQMSMNRQRAEDLANNAISSLLATKTMKRVDSSPRYAPIAAAGHGPLWLADPSAATCSETDVSDQFPPTVKSH